MPNSDQIVTAKIVLQTQLELQRQGIDKTMLLLEKTEPDLAEYLMETVTALHRQVLDAGASGREARQIYEATLTLVLVCFLSLQKAHAALWQEMPELNQKPNPPFVGGP